jgi:hypothetical protein
MYTFHPFALPPQKPGKRAGHQLCLWNGLLASAPAHPFLAKAIETIVNHVRNRFTSVDNDETFCEYHPNQTDTENLELSVLHHHDTLFTAGPCLLGSTVNRVLGRPAQTSFSAGEVKAAWDDKDSSSQIKLGTSFVQGIPSGADSDQQKQVRVPGRTIILRQNKKDMGSHRFTFVENNLLIASTDFPGSKDLKINKDNPQQKHYSSTHAYIGIYGVEELYTDRIIAYEDIRILVDASKQTQTFLKPSTILS